ncbi:MAG: DUF2017 family protein [Micrococcales bacterium]|nr:DUF2017 family protein [Micrococcales bacterium]OJX66251.1 MAG: hypothetical protein BGO94_04955 [Micrococcales bacterium 72-143]
MRIAAAPDGVRIEFAAEEAGLLTVLAHQFVDVVRDPELDDAPLLASLFPDAYRGDAEASAEFSRYTRDELEERKIAAAERISGTAREGLVVLDADEVEAWVRALTGIRTMVGTRLGIREDGDEPDAGPLAEIYGWLGELQWVLVDTMEGA